MSTYSFLSAGRIVGGADSIEQIKTIAADFGATSALIISDQGVSRAGLLERPKALLEAAGISDEFISYLHRTDARPIHFDKE